VFIAHRKPKEIFCSRDLYLCERKKERKSKEIVLLLLLLLSEEVEDHRGLGFCLDRCWRKNEQNPQRASVVVVVVVVVEEEEEEEGGAAAIEKIRRHLRFVVQTDKSNTTDTDVVGVVRQNAEEEEEEEEEETTPYPKPRDNDEKPKIRDVSRRSSADNDNDELRRRRRRIFLFLFCKQNFRSLLQEEAIDREWNSGSSFSVCS
jgi:hypothetical protein